MKRILVLVCLSLVIILSGCSLIYVDADSIIRVDVGGTFTLALDADPEAGYEWFASYDTTRLALERSWYDGDDQIAGKSGVQYLKFRTSRAGNSRIELVYMKLAEGPQPSDIKREFRVDIR